MTWRVPLILRPLERWPGDLTVFDRSYRSHSQGWQENLRAIALGLEALRKVDRYGIAKSGQQYRGWAALEMGSAGDPGPRTLEEAMTFVSEHSDTQAAHAGWLVAYRAAAKRLHPDAGGDTRLFQHLQQAKAILEREGLL